MADFCKACSIEIFGEDFGDLKGLISKREYDKGMSRAAICEDCGYILVDPDGNCSKCELKRNKEGHNIFFKKDHVNV